MCFCITFIVTKQLAITTAAINVQVFTRFCYFTLLNLQLIMLVRKQSLLPRDSHIEENLRRVLPWTVTKCRVLL